MISRTASSSVPSTVTSTACGQQGLPVALFALVALALSACGSSSDNGPSAPGGSSHSSGGASAIGAGGSAPALGGSSSAIGGQPGGSVGASGSPALSEGSSGGSSSGGSSSGGSSSGGSSNGGSSNGFSGQAGASGGASATGNAGAGNQSMNQVFSQSRFHFGTIDSIAKSAGSSMISELDFFTSGWMQGDSFDHSGVCNDTKSGAVFEKQVPVMVAYISAAHVKRQDKTMCDCNVTQSPCVASNDLCHQGAARIMQDFTDIVNAYKSYSSGFAQCYGTQKPIVFEMEPDWYQYTISEQTQPWTAKQAGQMLGQLVNALKSSLPNARFSIDVSPWVGPSNGTDNGASWYSNFDMSLFTFVNTSGGGTNANTAKIRSSNGMTWAGLNQVTGKPILADTGYGANGAAAGEDPLWNAAANINARIADGVVSISQYNPGKTWGSTVSGVRSQLSPLKFNP